MTAIDFQTLHAALDKDPKYQELIDRVRSYNTERAEYKQKQREALRKIIQFDMLEDLAMDKQMENECISEEYDKAIRENTGADTEVWSGRWHAASDSCFKVQVQAAIDVSNAQTMLDVVRDKQNVNSALMDARRNEVKAQLEKEQES